MRVISCFFFLIVIFTNCKKSPGQDTAEALLKGKTISLIQTAGWNPDPAHKISQPSNIISNNGYAYVFFVKEPVEAPNAGLGYSGKIHYAISRDQGNTWSDQGLLLNTGLPDAFDGQGVCKPTVIKATDDNFFYLYYVGIPVGFNNADESLVNRTSIGMAKLIFNEGDGAIRLAIKLNSAKAAIEPSEAGSGRFDAFRLDDPNAINMNGQIWLYYTGYDKLAGTPRTGLAVCANINEPHVKQNSNRAVLDGSPSLFQKQELGVLAVFSNTQQSWYASDGIHFSKLKSQFPSAIKYARANQDAPGLSWGLAEPTNEQKGFIKWQIK